MNRDMSPARRIQRVPKVNVLAAPLHPPSPLVALLVVPIVAPALAAALALPALQLAGYTPNAVNTPQALTTLTLAYAVIPCIIKIAAIILVARLPQEVNTP